MRQATFEVIFNQFTGMQMKSLEARITYSLIRRIITHANDIVYKNKVIGQISMEIKLECECQVK